MHIFTPSFKILFLFFVLSLVVYKVQAQSTDTLTKKKTDTVAVAKDRQDSGLKAKGVITDAATGKPISGINISVADYSAAITDDKGAFSIKVPSYTAVLIVSGQGYQSKETPLKGRNSVSTSLYEDTYNSVYSVAKTPYAEAPINVLTNAVTTVNTQGGWETLHETPDSYLQGRVAGLDAIRRSGTENIGADLFLRGFSSLNATNKPLIVVDGMIYDDAHYGNSLIKGHFNNPLANINFNDIDNITVIKDAASMYGTKAANGVILITTGHTNDLATKIDFGVYSGYNFKPANTPVLQASDYRVYLSDILHSSGMTDAAIQAQPYMNDNPSNPFYAAYHNNTNWQNEVFKNSYNQNYYLRVSGGDNVAKYTLSLGYGSDGGITKNTPLSTYDTRFNADLKLTEKFTVNANLSFTYNEQNLFDQGQAPKTNPLFLSLVKSPLIRLHQVDGNGVESPNLSNLDIFNIGNPTILIDTAKEISKSYRFFGNINFKYQFNRYASLQSAIGVTYDKVRESYFTPRAGVTTDTSRNAIIYSRLGSQVSRLYSITNDTHFAYDRVFNRIHHFTGNIGFRYIDYQSTDDVAQGANSTTDQFISVGTGSNLLRTTSGEVGASRWLNNYLGLNYILQNKYILSYNMAADASSRFGTQISGALNVGGLKLAVLPSLSAGWLVSSEPFMSGINFVELLKLRASYGLTGNDDIGNYAARQYYVSQNLLGQEGLVRGNIGNSALQWESNRKADIGFDASLLKERLSVTFDIYQNTTSNMIINNPTPAASGFTYAVDNSGGMRTQGIELAVNSRLINKPRLKWDLGFNISKYRNKITQLPNNSIVTAYAGANVLTQVGSAANLFYGYKTNGVYTSDAEAATAPKQFSANSTLIPRSGGDVRFVDVNGDGIIDSRDMTVIGNPNPDFTGGISTTLAYKRISLNALFTFSKGNQVYNYLRAQLEAESGYQNQTLAVLNRWRADGQVTDVPKATFGDPHGNSRFSDRWIEDGSYFRLRTASVTYNVPLKTKSLKSLKIYATGNNLFTLTKYLGYDPEFSATEGILTQGIDTGLEPQFRSVQLGVRLGL